MGKQDIFYIKILEKPLNVPEVNSIEPQEVIYINVLQKREEWG